MSTSHMNESWRGCLHDQKSTALDYFSDFLRASWCSSLVGIKANLLRGLFDTFFVLKYTKASCILSDQETNYIHIHNFMIVVF